MSKSKTKTKRRQYTDEYKREALGLAERVGVAKAASQLGIAESQLYNWRAKARSQLSQGDREQQQVVEIARLKRQLSEREEENAILKKAAQYFAKESR
jgi:transposase